MLDISTTATGRLPAGRPTRVRMRILALISLAVMVNYLDRAVLGVATPAIRRDFHLGPASMGVVFSAFSWSYFAAQAPVGLLLDRLGARLMYLVAIVGWSVSTLAHAAARSFGVLIGLRLSLGLFEAPCFPANSSIVGCWFPRAERSRAIAVYTAAEYVALGFASPLLFLVQRLYGWRSLFLISGGLGLLVALVWRLGYREPGQSRANAAELDLITRGGGRNSTAHGEPLDKVLLRRLVFHPQVVGLCIGQFAVYSTFTFFLTWFPTYLAEARHMNWLNAGAMASLPYLAGFFGILFAGLWSDWMLKRGASLDVARKLPVIVGLALACTIVLANYVRSDALVIAILSVAFFAQAMSSSGWAVLSEIAPEGALGALSGLFSAAANLSGIITPLVIGILFQATGSFATALAFVAAVAAAGALAWIFLTGPLRRIEL